jgi:hypothetical protein
MPGYGALERPSPNYGGARLGIQEEGEGQTIRRKKCSSDRLVQRHRTSIPVSSPASHMHETYQRWTLTLARREAKNEYQEVQ